MTGLSEPVRRFVQAFGFELPDGSTILIIATKIGPSSSAEDQRLTQRNAILSKLYAASPSVQTPKAEIVVINGRRAEWFRAIVGNDDVMRRTIAFRRGDAAFTADLVITTTDPSQFDAVADSFTAP